MCLNPLSLVIEYCAYGTLFSLIGDLEVSIDWNLRTKILLDIAKAMKYLHEQPITILHCDLKSPNVLLKSLNPDDLVCAQISDFGTAIKSNHPQIKRQVDNPTWLAPEILEGKKYHKPADIYSYGVIAWEIFTRQNYFGNHFFYDTEERVINKVRPPIPEECGELYKVLIETCWAQLPQERRDWRWIIQQIRQIDTTQTDINMKNTEYENRIKTRQQESDNKDREWQGWSPLLTDRSLERKNPLTLGTRNRPNEARATENNNM